METKNVEVSQKKLFFRFFFVGLISLFFLSNFAYGSDWYDENWDFRKLVTIDSTKVSGTHTNFPIIVDITDSELSAGANLDGSDILFTDSDGTTLLNFEIARYDSSTGQIVAWVKTPNLDSSTNGEIYMYYGNELQTISSENPTSVWSDYKNVWHLIENTLDSTENQDGTYSGTTETYLDGDSHTNRGFEFDGSENKISTSDGSYFDFISIDKDFSVSFWFQRENADSGGGDDKDIVYMGTTSNYWTQGFKIWTWGGTPSPVGLTFALSDDIGAETVVSTHTPELNSVVNYVFTYDSTNKKAKLYVDGVFFAEKDLSTFSGDFNTGLPFTIGGSVDYMTHESNAGTTYYDVKLSNSVLSDDEIITQYNNQDSSSTFLSLSSEEVPDTTGPTITDVLPEDKATVESTSQTISFKATDETALSSVTLNFNGR